MNKQQLYMRNVIKERIILCDHCDDDDDDDVVWYL